MIYKDYYKDLGITKNATAAEIKKAYRSQAKKHHPDRMKGDKRSEEKFKEINEANEVLSDPEKRKKYDQFGAEWKQYEQAGSRPGGFDWSKYPGGAPQQPGEQRQSGATDGMDAGSVEDLFEMLFGQHAGGRQRRRQSASAGEDLTSETTLTLDEAYHGTTRMLQVNGQTIKVTIRPGIADMQSLRVAGKGGAGSGGGPNGDIYITVRVAPHHEWRRAGNDLHGILRVELYTALLGGKSPVVTMKGKLAVTVPAGTQNGKELRLVGMGMPVYGRKNEYGNLLMTVSVILPSDLTTEERALFTTLAALRRSGGGRDPAASTRTGTI